MQEDNAATVGIAFDGCTGTFSNYFFLPICTCNTNEHLEVVEYFGDIEMRYIQINKNS